MSELIKYKLTFPKTQIRANTDELTFSIGKIKSRSPSIVYFKFYGYDLHDTLIATHTSNRWVITTEYTRQYETFDLTFTTGYGVADLDTYKIELYLLGIDSENPLWFNELQLNTGGDKDYHIPNEEKQNIQIGFNNNSYVNLYDTSETYLQIIRPVHTDFTTSELSKSECTILAPHLPNESEFDNPTALLYEYMYQTEQIIGVEK